MIKEWLLVLQMLVVLTLDIEIYIYAGEGLTGTVYLADNSLTGGQVAIRKVQLASLPWVGLNIASGMWRNYLKAP